MSEKVKSCIICAWRKTCQKKFNMDEGQINCPDFSEDIIIKICSEENNEIENRKNIKGNC